MLSIVAHLIGFDRPLKIMKENPDICGAQFAARSLKDFNIKYTVRDDRSHALTSTIYFCTHHTGALDFLISFNHLSKKSNNLKVIINDKLGSFEPISKVGITVHPLSSKKDNSSVRVVIRNHLESGGDILVFPAGKVARKLNGHIEDYEWRTGIFEVFKDSAKFGVPVFVDARNSSFFYFIRKRAPRLSMLFLMSCLKKAYRREANLYVGKEVPSCDFNGKSAFETMNFYREQTYKLKSRGMHNES